MHSLFSFQCLLPTLSPEYVAERTVDAIKLKRPVVYMPRALYLLLGLKGCVFLRKKHAKTPFRITPVPVLHYLGELFGTHSAMEHFESQQQRHQIV